MRVLLVDDDRTMQAILKTLLEIEKHEVIAWDGQPDTNFISLIEAEKPDVVILDVYLRAINGFDIIRQIRSSPTVSQVKTIMTSGMALKDECLAAGANEFLLKPYMPDEMLNMLK